MSPAHPPHPLQKGDLLELEVGALAFGGAAVGRAPDGRVVFVTGGTPGDRAEVRLDEVKANFTRASLVRVLAPGPSRVAPRCPLTDRCGGCQWQEVAIESQRAAKQDIVARALGRLGAAVTPLVEATPPFGYRSRVRLAVAPGTGRGDPVSRLGFSARRSHEIVDVPACPLLEPSLEEALAIVRALLLPVLLPGATVSALAGRGGVHLALADLGPARAAARKVAMKLPRSGADPRRPGRGRDRGCSRHRHRDRRRAAVLRRGRRFCPGQRRRQPDPPPPGERGRDRARPSGRAPPRTPCRRWELHPRSGGARRGPGRRGRGARGRAPGQERAPGAGRLRAGREGGGAPRGRARALRCRLARSSPRRSARDPPQPRPPHRARRLRLLRSHDARPRRRRAIRPRPRAPPRPSPSISCPRPIMSRPCARSPPPVWTARGPRTAPLDRAGCRQ